MTNEKRRLSIITALLMSFFILVGMSNGVYAAQVGQVLPQPEEGWRRYDDTDSNITYSSNWVFLQISEQYNNTVHQVKGSQSGDTARFNFIGSKLNLITTYYNRYPDASITIDGKEYSFSTTEGGGSVIRQVVGFSIDDLDFKEHSVVITQRSVPQYNLGLVIDAIDIDENGELLPYDPDIDNNPGIILDIEPEKEKIKITEEVYADLTIDNIKEIAAEDVRIQYDNEKLDFLGFEEVEGMKLVKSIEDIGNGELRVILASKGEANIVNTKETLLRLKFKGKAIGEAKVDIIKARVSDGIEMEEDLTDEQCDEGIIIIEGINDVNNSGEFTLLDLAIDARHLEKDPNSFPQYNTDIVVNGAIDEDDLLEIAKLMLENSNYAPNL